ncbi:MAG: carboxypeptidase-like regulatory domain-containing protein [Acidobacteriota bacterium]
MRISFVCIALLVLASTFAGPPPSYAQGGSGEATKNANKGAGKGSGRPPKPRNSNRTAAPASPAPAPRYAELTVNTGLPECSVLLDGQARGTTDRSGVFKLSSLSPGQHIITVRREGHYDGQSTVQLLAGRSEVVEITLTRKLSTAEVLKQAEDDYRGARYDQAIEKSRRVLNAQPDSSRANLLLGESYYLTGNAESTAYLVKAIRAGEDAVIPIKHHHRTGLTGVEDALCSGTLTLRKTSFEFHSLDMSGHDLTAGYEKITELKNEAGKAGRLHLKVGVPKGNKEDKKDYNFHVSAAVVRSNGVRQVAYCDSPSCLPMVETLYQLLQQLKQ